MAEKALHKIQHTFMIKILNKQRIEKLFQHSKATYKKSKANIILNGEKVKKKKKAFPLRSEMRKMPLLPLLFSIVLGVLARAIGHA